MNNPENGLERAKKFKDALRRIFASPDGELVLEFLEQSYVEGSAVDRSTELTYYRLGQKEFVQALIKDATTDETFEEVTIGVDND